MVSVGKRVGRCIVEVCFSCCLFVSGMLGLWVGGFMCILLVEDNFLLVEGLVILLC